MAMVSCVACGELTRNGCSCDHCGTTLKTCGTAQSALLAVLGLVLTGCPPAPVQADYGVALTDADNDGYYSEEDDCDDGDASIHPGATETAGDGVDSDCDGEDDPASDTGE